LRDNGLKVLDDGVILKSQAQLAASLSADWTAEERASCEKLLGQLDPANPLFAALAAHLPR
jgi:ATP phosphoribosyltransferase